MKDLIKELRAKLSDIDNQIDDADKLECNTINERLAKLRTITSLLVERSKVVSRLLNFLEAKVFPNLELSIEK